MWWSLHKGMCYNINMNVLETTHSSLYQNIYNQPTFCNKKIQKKKNQHYLFVIDNEFEWWKNIFKYLILFDATASQGNSVNRQNSENGLKIEEICPYTMTPQFARESVQ